MSNFHARDISGFLLFVNISQKKCEPDHCRQRNFIINSKLTVKEILEGPLDAEKVKKSIKVVENLVNTVLLVENKSYNLLKITSDDHYAYTHALNVCTFSIGLGMAIKLKKTLILWN